MKNIAVIPNPKKDKEFLVTNEVVKTIVSAGGNVYIDNKYRCCVSENVFYYDEFPPETDLIVVVGGDGSMLDASRKAVEFDIPLVGVNLGRVGYLSEVERDNIQILNRVFTGEYKLEEKMLLTTELHSSDSVTYAERLAVNDVVIGHDSYLGIAEFTVETLGGSVKYRADGLVISTPAGSTAYSLSAGGPIVSHRLEAMVVTPVCPHSFFDRSMVFSPSDIIKIKNTGEEKLNISIDGRYFSALLPDEVCIARVCDKKVKILSFNENNMFATLFKKMRILEDVK